MCTRKFALLRGCKKPLKLSFLIRQLNEWIIVYYTLTISIEPENLKLPLTQATLSITPVMGWGGGITRICYTLALRDSSHSLDLNELGRGETLAGLKVQENTILYFIKRKHSFKSFIGILRVISVKENN